MLSDVTKALEARRIAEEMGVDPSHITLHGGETGRHSYFLRSGHDTEGMCEMERRICFSDGRKDYDEPVMLPYGSGHVERMLLVDCAYVIEVVTQSTPHGDSQGFAGIRVYIWDGVDPQLFSQELAAVAAGAISQAA